jgi:queuine tRNA-ribosyltransferase
MGSIEADKFAHLPNEMFSIIKSASQGLGPRLGRLSLAGRNAIETPHYLGITSRGVVPHLTQDTFARDTSIGGVYVPLEDCTLAPAIRTLAR